MVIGALETASSRLKQNGFRCVNVTIGSRGREKGILAVFHGNVSSENFGTRTADSIKAMVEEQHPGVNIHFKDNGTKYLREDQLDLDAFRKFHHKMSDAEFRSKIFSSSALRICALQCDGYRFTFSGKEKVVE